MICRCSKKQKSVVTSICEVKFMVLRLATKQWIWVMKALGELNVPATNAAIYCDTKATIEITNNPKIRDQSKYTDISYHFISDNIESGWLYLCQVEWDENLATICTKGLP
jgi:hypothetical protein